MKLRIPDQASTIYGSIEFVKGVSVRGVTPREANHLRAIISGVEILQNNGEEVDEILNGMEVILPRGYYEDARLPVPSEFLSYWDGTMPNPALSEDAKVVSANVSVESIAEPAIDATDAKFARADLEAIASEKGIAGLREIAEPLGVTGRSIVVLIDALMQVKS